MNDEDKRKSKRASRLLESFQEIPGIQVNYKRVIIINMYIQFKCPRPKNLPLFWIVMISHLLLKLTIYMISLEVMKVTVVVIKSSGYLILGL